MKKSIQQVYDQIALYAFNNYSISRENDIGKMEIFRLAEIEIYMIDKKNNINDIFIHKNKEQLKYQVEYEHYSGFDICLGNEIDIYCAILVRGIINDKESIYGPGRVKYKRKNGKKESRNIEINYEDRLSNNVCFLYPSIDTSILLENIVFKLPRVNLGDTTSSKYLDSSIDLEELDTYLNLKARYIRLSDEKFHKYKNPPEESREVFNSLIQYKKYFYESFKY